MDSRLDEATEIRKVPAFYIAELSRILSTSNQWKELMAKIPKTLSKESYECEINDSNSAKYVSEHYSLIEKASLNSGRLCSEILLDEWGCSGRVRPALGHLLHLLKKSELYRAADYVSIDILKKGPVQRPSQGPLAFVQIHTTTQEALDGSQASNSDVRGDQLPIFQSVLPNIPEFHPPPPLRSLSPLGFLSRRHQSAEKSTSKVVLPDFSFFHRESRDSDVVKPLILPFANLMNPSSQAEGISNLGSSFLPNVTLFKAGPSQSNVLPPLSDLLHPSLPKLNIKTDLHNFPYERVKTATDNFNTTPLTLMGHTVTGLSGRFLGSGAFGSVHYAVGLLRKPVAVKKIYLKKAVLNENEFVLRQFKNEVEVLCDYKHKNLLRLIGFSCDGPGYCLVYEYISGGNLKDRLQERENILTWPERVVIAQEIADAVNYLHTAKAKPLIHRDIKTTNILLDDSNTPKLCDFGTLRVSSTTTTETTKIYGTSAYMAPEANRGDVSVKMDTYSFGVVLLELLTSLLVMDNHREGYDLVTYVDDYVTDDIAPLLDMNSWSSDAMDFADELFRISKNCLKEKRSRPTMTDVNIELLQLRQKLPR